MSVFFGRSAVGGPARVADAVGALDGRFLQDFFEVAQLTGGATNLELAILRNHRDSGGIVAAVFQFAKSFDDYGHNFFRSDITDDSTHGTMAPGNVRLSSVTRRFDAPRIG